MVGGIFFFKQKTAYEMRISDWSSDVCSSDLRRHYLRVSDVATSATRAASGSRGMTSYVYGSELDIIVCASGAGVAGTSRRRSLSRLASDCRARERTRRSEKNGRTACRGRVCQYG